MWKEAGGIGAFSKLSETSLAMIGATVGSL